MRGVDKQLQGRRVADFQTGLDEMCDMRSREGPGVRHELETRKQGRGAASPGRAARRPPTENANTGALSRGAASGGTPRNGASRISWTKSASAANARGTSSPDALMITSVACDDAPNSRKARKPSRLGKRDRGQRGKVDDFQTAQGRKNFEDMFHATRVLPVNGSARDLRKCGTRGGQADMMQDKRAQQRSGTVE
ncbi:hypothetical protein AURDEDRAFT_125248 [Auricularia subglabra TFB-10046 SS5]|nr:hypothetical protein AURDEDRAFT_125248 [Auricularia subglabra TFB-10046 SS5]